MARAPGHEPLFDIHPLTGATIEVFYADGRLETFGRYGAGWFWCCRRRGFSPPATGPFSTSYAAYRDALLAIGFETREVRLRTRMFIRRILDDFRWALPSL